MPTTTTPLLPAADDDNPSADSRRRQRQYGRISPLSPKPSNEALLRHSITNSSDPQGICNDHSHPGDEDTACDSSSLDGRDTQSEAAVDHHVPLLHPHQHLAQARARWRASHRLEQGMAKSPNTPHEAGIGLENQIGSNYGLSVNFGMQEIEELRLSGDYIRRAANINPHYSPCTRRSSAATSDAAGNTLDGAHSDEDDDDDGDDQDYDPSDPPDNSPYPQVRASVPATDDITLSINTPRMWTLSMVFAILGSGTNLFFSLRYPSVSLTPVIALLLVHPLGLLWDALLKCSDDPTEHFIDGNLVRRRFSTSHTSISRTSSGRTDRGSFSSQAYPSSAHLSPFKRLRLWLAQGRWNEKEHACVYISSNVSFGFAFATDVIVEQTKFYNQETSIVYQILLTLSTQILGYSIAGVTRRYLVRPSGMIWPSTLISTAMFSTLHTEENHVANGWRMSRWRFFLVIFLGSCAWFFLPGLLMPALSYFSVITWFAPDNVVVANLFGTSSGLGLFPLTFDWSQIAYTGSPLVAPFWAALNVFGGLVAVMWLAAPLMYYANVLYSSYMPILSASVFDNRGHLYEVSRILTPDFVFDEQAYTNYSRVFLPITYVLSYATQFAALTALITHTICWHGRDILVQGRQSFIAARQPLDTKKYDPVPSSDEQSPDASASSMNRNGNGYASTTIGNKTAVGAEFDDRMNFEDVHNRLMRRYEDVPMWWYLLTGVSMLAVGIFVVEHYDVHLPWYGLLLAFGICCVLFIPIAIVMAITSQQSSIYLVCQIICGFIFPGRPVANMVFVTYGYITSTQGMKFSSDMKLGHYMKIPPRLLFGVQVAATIVSSLTQIGVLNWMLDNVPGICTPEAINGFTCPIARVHFNGSILWGVVGPSRFFGKGALYQHLVWAFLVGAIAPPIIYYIASRRPHERFWRKISFPVIFGALSWIPPATGLNFSVWALVCYIFNYVIRTRKEAWWKKYNMTLSAALDAGVAFGVVIVFFGFIYPGLANGFSWWGTEVYKQGCDWRACPYRELKDGETFGPSIW